MERNNLDELLSVLEVIRSEQFPDIPEQVVIDIVNTQYENQSEIDRVRSRLQTQQIILRFLNDVVAKEKE